MKPTVYRFLFAVFVCLQTVHLAAQTEGFIGPGFGTNRNKTMVESQTQKYKLTPYNTDFKLDLGVFMAENFYLNATYNIYRQDIYNQTFPNPLPATGLPNTGYTRTHYTYTSRYLYQGFSVVPAFAWGNRVKFFAGAGFNFDFSRISGNTVHVNQDHYGYDSTGNYIFESNTSYDTTNTFGERNGSDFSALVQAGVLVNLGSSLMLQVNALFRRSLELTSLNAPGDYKSNAGLSVSILYRLWGRKNERAEPVE